MARRFLILLGVFAVLVAGFFVYREIRNARIARRATELGKVLEEEIREWEARVRSRPPLFEPAVEGTAWEHYQEADRLKDELDESWWDVERALDIDLAVSEWKGFPEPPPPGADRWVEYLGPALLAVRKGTSTSRTGPALDPRQGVTTLDHDDAPGPWEAMTWVNHLSVPLKVRAAVSLEASEPEDAVSWILVRSRMSEDLVNNAGTMLSTSGRAGVCEIRRELACLVGGGLLPADQVDRVAAQPPSPVPGWATVYAEYLTVQGDLMQIAQGHDGWLRNPFSESNWYERVLYSVAEPGRADALDTWLRLREEYPVWRRTWPGDDPATHRKASDGIARTMDGSSTAWRMFALAVQQAFLASLYLQTDAEEAQEMLVLNIALFRYRQREGKDPETIDEIRPVTVRAKTSLGIWDWRESNHAPKRWIVRGTLADEEKRNAATKQQAEEFMEVLEESDLLK